MTFYILAVFALIIVQWFSAPSKAWFKETRTTYLRGNSIFSVTEGEANNVASFKNKDDFDDDFEFDEIVGDFIQKFIPGDVLYYTFVISDVDISGEGNLYNLELDSMEVGVLDNSDIETAIAFASNLRIEENTVMVAMLERKYSEELEDVYLHELFYNQQGKAFYGVDEGLENTEVDYFYKEENPVESPLVANMLLTLPQNMEYPEETDETGKVDILVLIPIWYIDTEVNQNDEMNSFIEIAGALFYKVSGD